MPESSGQNLAEGAEKLNASQIPRLFYARHMQPGIVGYGDETILVDTDALKKLIASASGKGIPVYLHHNEESHETRLQNLKEQAVGYVTDSFYNELDGWAYFKFLAVDDAAHKAIGDGWSISNAYVPSRWSEGGSKNNLPYHREVIDGEFTHLAIVPDPRYEDACIMSPEQFKVYQESKKSQIAELQNAKSATSKGSPMFKLFKNKREEVAADAIDADTMIELQNGKTVTVAEMINALTKSKDEEKLVDVGGEKMPLKELVKRFGELSNSKKEEDDCKMNDSEEEEKKEEEKENDEGEGEEDDKKREKKDEKKNRKARHNKAEDEKEEKEEEKDNEDEDEDEGDGEKKNSRKHFDELKNANLKSGGAVHKIETSTDQVARGTARYGSTKAA